MVKKIKTFLFSNQTRRQTIAKNTIWLVIGNLGGRLLRVIVIIYAARVLGAAEWGVFSYVINLVALITIFVDIGIGPVLTRESVKAGGDENYKAKVLSTAFYTKSAILALGVIMVAFLTPYLTDISGIEAILHLAVLVLIFDALREFGFAVSRALEKMEFEGGLMVLTNSAIMVLGFLSLTTNPTAKSFMEAYTVGTGVGFAATFLVLRNRLSGIFTGFYPKLIKPIIASALPFAVSGLLVAIMTSTATLVIGIFGSSEEVGLYSAVQRIILTIYLLPTILATGAFPAFARLANKDNARVRDILERVLGLSFMAIFPIVFGGLVAAPDVVNLIFGAEYLPSAGVFSILLISLIFSFSVPILSNVIFAYDKQKVLIIYAVMGGALNLILSFVLIPLFGIVGAAWATLIAQVAGGGIYLWKATKNIVDFRIGYRLKKILSSSFLTSVAFWAMIETGVPIWLGIILSIPVYFGYLSITKEPLVHEIKSILRGDVLRAPVSSESAAL